MHDWGRKCENKQDVVDTIRRIPLSANTNTRKTEVLAEESYKGLKQLIAATDRYALALDESCDITDSRLIVFVRFLDNAKEQFVEELLTMLPMTGQTRGEDLYKALMEHFEKAELDLERLYQWLFILRLINIEIVLSITK